MADDVHLRKADQVAAVADGAEWIARLVREDSRGIATSSERSPLIDAKSQCSWRNLLYYLRSRDYERGWNHFRFLWSRLPAKVDERQRCHLCRSLLAIPLLLHGRDCGGFPVSISWRVFAALISHRNELIRTEETQ
jgi:hypothetical protein